jgi:hypothetical protein
MIYVSLPHELDEFLQWMGNQTRWQGGYKLAKTEILRAMARVFQEYVRKGEIDLRGIFTESDFVKRVGRAMGGR